MNLNDRAFVIWLTGLPGSGKTTIANKINSELRSRNIKSEMLDGDELRKNISSELGFSKTDREIHVRRAVFLCDLLSRNGITCVVSLISPYLKMREFARKTLPNFVEVWVKCSIETCIQRDPKGLYKNALDGKVSDLTGLQSTYEPPIRPEITLDTDVLDTQQCVKKVLDFLLNLRVLE
ncbi:MAG: adenylyl-sulfate kinase [Thermoproteota archaeon]|nr:adenylyl-sulfate kinase [Thermoproteota archaeon]